MNNCGKTEAWLRAAEEMLRRGVYVHVEGKHLTLRQINRLSIAAEQGQQKKIVEPAK